MFDLSTIDAPLQVVSEIKLEQGELYKDIEKYQEQIATTEETIKGFEEQIAELREAADAAKVCVITLFSKQCHSYVPSCQQHLIFMRYSCRHCQRIDFVEPT